LVKSFLLVVAFLTEQVGDSPAQVRDAADDHQEPEEDPLKDSPGDANLEPLPLQAASPLQESGASLVQGGHRGRGIHLQDLRPLRVPPPSSRWRQGIPVPFVWLGGRPRCSRRSEHPTEECVPFRLRFCGVTLAPHSRFLLFLMSSSLSFSLSWSWV